MLEPSRTRSPVGALNASAVILTVEGAIADEHGPTELRETDGAAALAGGEIVVLEKPRRPTSHHDREAVIIFSVGSVRIGNFSE
jgi:hypothetical protein